MGLLGMARLAELAVGALVVYWAAAYKSSFHRHSSPTSQLDLIYAVLHPVLMVIGFIILTGEAILAHRWLAGWSLATRMSVHLLLQGAALGFGALGIWTRFRGERGVVANFYSLHSWIGLICLASFAAQWVLGFLTFWHRPTTRQTRAATLPWHVFAGLYTYALGVVAAETGLLEKLTFLQVRNRGAAPGSAESRVVNGLGLGLMMLAGFVVFAAVSRTKTSSSSGGKGGRIIDSSGGGTNGFRQYEYHNGKPHAEDDDGGDGKRKYHVDG